MRIPNLLDNEMVTVALVLKYDILRRRVEETSCCVHMRVPPEPSHTSSVWNFKLLTEQILDNKQIYE